MRRSTALWLGLALGCSAPATSRTPATQGSSRAPSVPPIARETPEAPLPTGDAETLRVLRFTDGSQPRIQSLPSTVVEVPNSASPYYEPDGDSDSYDALTGGPSSYPVVEFPEHADALNAQIREQSLEIMEELAQGERRGSTVCRAATARTDLVVITCTGIVLPDRSAPEPWVFSRHYRVEGAVMTRFEVRDALLPGTQLDDLIRERCRRMVARESLRDPGPEYCDDAVTHAKLSFEAGGLRVSYQRPMSSYSFEFLRAQIRYRALDGVVLADGPLGPVLGEHATVVSVPRPDVPDATGAGRAVSSGARLGELMHRWAALPEAQREAVLVAADEDATRGRLVVPDAVPTERADAIAVALGAEASEPIGWVRPPLTPVWVVTRRSTSLRRRPGRARWERTPQLAAGTLALSLRGGRLGRHESALGRRDTWAFTSPAPGLQGWAAGNLLREHEGCRPSAESVVASLPESTRERASRTMITAQTRVRRRNAWVPAVAFAATLQPMRRRGTRGRVYLEVRELDPDTCSVGRRMTRVDREGSFFGLGVIQDQAAAGGVLFALGVLERGHDSNVFAAWSLHEVRGRASPVWSSESGVDAVEVAPAGAGDGVLLRYVRRRRVVVLERSPDGFAIRDVGPAPD